jgi:septal ring factor EnvC (AmiA/AmiB activator)
VVGGVLALAATSVTDGPRRRSLPPWMLRLGVVAAIAWGVSSLLDAVSPLVAGIVLGAVVPELRAETTILLADIRELASLRGAIVEERERLLATIREQASEKQRLSLLLEEKRKLLSASESSEALERRRVEELADKADALKKDLADVEARRAAAEPGRWLKGRRAIDEEGWCGGSRRVPATPWCELRGRGAGGAASWTNPRGILPVKDCGTEARNHGQGARRARR